MNPALNVDRTRLSIQRMRERLMPKPLYIDAPNEAAVCRGCLNFILAGEKRATIGNASRCERCWTVKP